MVREFLLGQKVTERNAAGHARPLSDVPLFLSDVTTVGRWEQPGGDERVELHIHSRSVSGRSRYPAIYR